MWLRMHDARPLKATELDARKAFDNLPCLADTSPTKLLGNGQSSGRALGVADPCLPYTGMNSELRRYSPGRGSHASRVTVHHGFTIGVGD